jgi:glycerol-3-phosphate dehydrogenase
MVASTEIKLKGLTKKAMAELKSKARRMGLTSEEYLRELVQEDLALDRKARNTTFAEIMGPGQEVDEAELDALVEAARTRHYRRTSRKG